MKPRTVIAQLLSNKLIILGTAQLMNVGQLSWSNRTSLMKSWGFVPARSQVFNKHIKSTQE